MTIKEMAEFIDVYRECRSIHSTGRDCCDGCKIGDFCESIDGDFGHNEPECKKAYEILAGSEAEAHDNVNHPAHYETGKFECIDVMCEAIGTESVKDFCLCNAFKYLYRCNRKHDTPIEDVEKAVWYLNKYLELEGEKA